MQENYFQNLSESEDEILQGFEGWKFRTRIFSKKFYTYPPSYDDKIPLLKDRDIPKIAQEIKNKVKEFVRKAVKEIDANWLDLNNDLIRKELTWDINGYLNNLRESGYFEDYNVLCDNHNNPPEIFKKGGLVVEIMIIWDQINKTTIFETKAEKDMKNE